MPASPRTWAGGLVAIVTPRQSSEFAAAGFELFEARGLAHGRAAAYLCEDFVCKLPVTDATELRALFG